MEILQKCKEWLGAEPDVNTVKLKLGEVENSLSSRNAVTQLLEGWLEQLDNEVDLPSIELNLFSDDVKPSITKWLNWLTAENPDRDVVCERLKSAQKQSEKYQLAVEALVEYLGEDYVESEHLESIAASKQVVSVGEMTAPSGSYEVGSKSGSEDGSYSLESAPDKDIPSYASKEEKLSAFEALKNQLGTTTIVTNRKQIEED